MSSLNRSLFLLFALVVFPWTPKQLGAQSTATLQQSLQLLLDSARIASRWPGATLAVGLPDGRIVAVASGLSHTARKAPMRTSDRRATPSWEPASLPGGSM